MRFYTTFMEHALCLKVWFPRTDSLVDSIMKRRVHCQVATPQPSHELLQMTLLPNHPRKQVSIDFVKLLKPMPLLYPNYSTFPEIKIEWWFSGWTTYLLPMVYLKWQSPIIVPPLIVTSSTTAKYFSFKHRKVSPLWPKGNGEVGCFVRTFMWTFGPSIAKYLLVLISRYLSLLLCNSSQLWKKRSVVFSVTQWCDTPCVI